MLIKTPLLHQSFGLRVFLSFSFLSFSLSLSLFLSLSFWLIPWSAEAGCLAQGILASFLLSLSHRQLRTTKFRSIKGPTILKCNLLLLNVTMNHFLIWLWCATESGFYITTSDDQFGGWTEKKLQSSSQSQTCTKKRSWSLFGGLLPIWSTTAFWIPVKPLHLRSMLSKSVRCTENCNASIWY